MNIDIDEIERQANLIDERRDTIQNSLTASYNALEEIMNCVGSADTSSSAVYEKIEILRNLIVQIHSKAYLAITNIQTEMLTYVEKTKDNEETLSEDIITSSSSMEDVLSLLDTYNEI